MSRPTFRQIAQMSSGPTTLIPTIAGETFEQIGSVRVKTVLNDWTDTDEFVELFRAAREGADVPDERFVESLARQPQIRTRPDPFGTARQIVAALLRAWHKRAAQDEQPSNRAPTGFAQSASSGVPGTDTSSQSSSDENPWYSLIITIVAALGIAGGVIGVFAITIVVVGGLGDTRILGPAVAGASLLLGAFGAGLCAVIAWISWALLQRKNWARIVHIPLFALGAIGSLLTGLLSISLLDLVSAVIQVGIVYVLTRPEVKAEFTSGS